MWSGGLLPPCWHRVVVPEGEKDVSKETKIFQLFKKEKKSLFTGKTISGLLHCREFRLRGGARGYGGGGGAFGQSEGKVPQGQLRGASFQALERI